MGSSSHKAHAARAAMRAAEAMESGQGALPKATGTVDSHCHIFDPARFPYVMPRRYTPGAATVEELKTLHEEVGVDRTVLVQPSVYGTDNRCLLHALAALGLDAARAVAVVNPATVSNSDLEALRAAGVVGVRINLVGVKIAADAVSAIADMLNRIGSLDFVVQAYVDLELVDRLASVIASAQVPVVLDHFGGAKAALGTRQPGFAALLRLVEAGHVYVKLSAPYRASQYAPHYPDLAPLARALIAANPERLVWGSDWPHTGGGGSQQAFGDIEPFHSVSERDVLPMLSDWSESDTVYRMILVDNAARLFRF